MSETYAFLLCCSITWAGTILVIADPAGDLAPTRWLHAAWDTIRDFIAALPGVRVVVRWIDRTWA